LRPGPGLIQAVANTVAATSDSNVWVFGGRAVGGSPLAERFGGSVWTDESPTLPGPGNLNSAVITPGGDVYIAGARTRRSTGAIRAGFVWKFDGTQWTDVTPATPAHQYNALALAGRGTLVAVGSKPGPVLQEFSQGTWTTVPMPTSASLTAVTTAPGGTAVAAGRDHSGPILVRLRPGAASATVLNAPAAPVHPRSTTETGVVAVAPGTIWLLGLYVSANGTTLPWVVGLRRQGLRARPHDHRWRHLRAIRGHPAGHPGGGLRRPGL